MKISILHPSYNRPGYGPAAARAMLENMSWEHEVEYIVCLWTDEPHEREYRDNLADLPVAICTSEERSCVAQLNRAAAAATGDLLCSMGDDVFPGWRWDSDIAIVASENWDRFQGDFVIRVSDGLRTDELITQLIVTRKWYDRHGYMLWPEYRAWASDNDFSEMAQAEGRVVDARELTWYHRHFLNDGPIPLDETYAIQCNSADARHGEEVLRKRRRDGFGIRWGRAGV